jgi:hypothetical protein
LLRIDAGHGLDRGTSGDMKVFWFFSSEKNILAFLVVTRARSDQVESACGPMMLL